MKTTIVYDIEALRIQMLKMRSIFCKRHAGKTHMSPNVAKPEPRAQELLSDFQRGVRAVLIGPPGSGKGTQVNK